MASESSTREHARSSNAAKDNGGKRAGNKTPLLSQFSRDITALAKAGKLDPVIGRTSEIERIFTNTLAEEEKVILFSLENRV